MLLIYPMKNLPSFQMTNSFLQFWKSARIFGCSNPQQPVNPPSLRVIFPSFCLFFPTKPQFFPVKSHHFLVELPQPTAIPPSAAASTAHLSSPAPPWRRPGRRPAAQPGRRSWWPGDLLPENDGCTGWLKPEIHGKMVVIPVLYQIWWKNGDYPFPAS